MQGAQPKRNLAAWLAAFFLIVLGAKLWTIQIWATNIPFWDQWNEAQMLFKPWLAGTLTWHDFFIPHNEHRILVTRLLDLLEVKLNGQWDPLLQMAVNAVIHTGYGCLLATAIWEFAGRRHAGLVCMTLLPFFALPFAGENVLHGFQSQMYFVSIFSITAILGLGFGKPAGRAWFCGLAAAVLAIFTMASGFLAAGTVVGLVVLRLLKQRRLSRGEWLTLLSSLAVVALGLSLKVTVAKHEEYRAQSIGDFLGALRECLAWPYATHGLLAILFCLPLGILFIAHLRRDFKNPRAAEFALALGLFALLQYFVLAYGRAELIGSSRYQDTLCSLVIAGLASLFVLADNLDFPRRARVPTAVLAAGWVAVLMLGVCKISYVNLTGYLHSSRSWGLLETENVRAFIATDDDGWLKSKSNLAIPCWSPDLLAGMLRDPQLLSIMPADVRPPLKLAPDETLSAGFSTNGCPPGKAGQPFTTIWGSFSTNSVANARFVSRPLPACLPKLSVQVYRGTGAVTMKLVGVNNRTVELHPQFSDRWETLIVDAPPGPLVLSVENASSAAPAAIGEIKELGRFSVYAHDLIAHAALVLSLGLCLCILLAGVALSRPGMALHNQGLAWLVVLLVALTALFGTCCWRNFDSEEYAFRLQKEWAVNFVSNGHPGRADLHLREAMWLRPGDVETQKDLDVLEARGLGEPLPEKTP